MYPGAGGYALKAYDRFRRLVQGPDGNLYVATDEGAISRLTPN